jgi:tRNA1Val (adenine37-N6)-methyltransferase
VANPYFQFKQFTVHQEHTAMKVCTDACLFGAWAANDPQVASAQKILDIGSGTGLLSLMLAQKSTAIITAIEIEDGAYKQTKANFESSPWQDRLLVEHMPIQDYAKQYKLLLYDCIITNPPFFEGDLQSPDASKNLASHSVALPWEDLAKAAGLLLQDHGAWYVLVPTLRAYTMQKLAATFGMQLTEEVLMYNDAKHLPIRAMLKFVKQESATNMQRNKMIIKNADQSYTNEFTSILKDYYLHF